MQPALGLEILKMATQGSSFLATLGYKMESRWDSEPFSPLVIGH